MHILQSALVLGLVCLDAAVAAPSNAKLTKRTITVNRVAAGWIERDALHMKVQAMQKFGMPMSEELKQAHVVNRAQAKARALSRQQNAQSGSSAGETSQTKEKGNSVGTGNSDGISIGGGGIGIGSGNNGGLSIPGISLTLTAPEPRGTGNGGERGNRNGTENGRGEGRGNGRGDGRGEGRGNGTSDGRGEGRGSGRENGRGEGSAGSNGTNQQGGRQTGQVTNLPEPGDVEYLSEVIIGGQKIVMNFDTGSSDFWVFSTNLNANSQKGHTVFDPAKSNTFQAADPNVANSFNIRFGDGSSASGTAPLTIGTDVVSIGGATAQKATVELADTVSGSFVTDVASNGLVGFAFSKINTVKPTAQKTFFDTIADDLEQPILAADLRAGAPGSYTLGKVDNSAFVGQLTEVPINNTQGFWQFQSNTFSVGGGPVQTSRQSSPAIADTGTTLLLADPDVINGYYSQVQGAAQDRQTGLILYPCSSNLPDLSLAVGDNYKAVIPGRLLNFQAVDSANRTCAGSLQSNNGAGIQIYGDIFFKAQYTVFNVRANTISVAPHS